jgi:hypothetical protein
VNSTVEDVSIKEGLSYASMAGTMERRIEARVDWSGIVEIKTLGLDEIALKKGHRDYVTLVTGRFRPSVATYGKPILKPRGRNSQVLGSWQTVFM